MKKILFSTLSIGLIILLFLRATAPKRVSLNRQTIASWQEKAPKKNHTSISKAHAIVKKMVQEENIVGLSISVSVNDTIIWSEGFSHSDLNQTKPIIPHETLFRIASISKPFTATLLGRLQEENKLDWDQSLYTYVPDFPQKKYDFTLRQLAMHRAGIRHYKWYESENKKALSIEEGKENLSILALHLVLLLY